MREAAQLNAVLQSSGEISCRYASTTKYQATMAFAQGTVEGVSGHTSLGQIRMSLTFWP